MTKTLLVVVPKPGSRPAAVIDPGSGIVTTNLDDSFVRVYFEGNRYDAVNMRKFSERVLHAAGRLDYPTVAMGVWHRDNFDVIGTFSYSLDWREHELTFTDLDTLRAWLEGA